jgi:glycosyl transferase family 25
VIPIFVINLERARDRRRRIEADLARLGLSATFLPAVDGTSISQSIYSKTYMRELLPGEIGCYLSHLNAARAVAESGSPFGCVLEDDAVLAPSALTLLRQDALLSLPDFDILRLEAIWRRKHLPIKEISGIQVVAPYYPDGGSRAQIYSARGARKVSTDRSSIKEPIDVHLYYDPPLRRFRLLDVAVSCATEATTQSYIGHDRNTPVPDRFRKLRYRLRRKANFVLAWGVQSFATVRK